MRNINFLFLSLILGISILIPLAKGHSETRLSVRDLLNRMKGAFDDIRDYQMDVEIRSPEDSHSFQIERFKYTFKRPDHIRIDMKSPHRDMILVYPGPGGKVLIRPGGWARSFTFSLSSDNFLLRDSSGQRIDQTDLGLLIENISLSIEEAGEGHLEISETGRWIRIVLLADDHFRPGVITRYIFLIDRSSCMPVKVEEWTPQGNLKRVIIFKDLETNTGVGDSFFSLNEE